MRIHLIKRHASFSVSYLRCGTGLRSWRSRTLALIYNEKLWYFIQWGFLFLFSVTKQEYKLRHIVDKDVVPVSIIKYWTQNECGLLDRSTFSLYEFLLTLTRLLLRLATSSWLFLNSKIVTHHDDFIGRNLDYDSFVARYQNIVRTQTIKYRPIYVSKVMLCRLK